MLKIPSIRPACTPGIPSSKPTKRQQPSEYCPPNFSSALVSGSLLKALPLMMSTLRGGVRSLPVNHQDLEVRIISQILALLFLRSLYWRLSICR